MTFSIVDMMNCLQWQRKPTERRSCFNVVLIGVDMDICWEWHDHQMIWWRWLEEAAQELEYDKEEVEDDDGAKEQLQLTKQ